MKRRALTNWNVGFRPPETPWHAYAEMWPRVAKRKPGRKAGVQSFWCGLLLSHGPLRRAEEKHAIEHRPQARRGLTHRPGLDVVTELSPSLYGTTTTGIVDIAG